VAGFDCASMQVQQTGGKRKHRMPRFNPPCQGHLALGEAISQLWKHLRTHYPPDYLIQRSFFSLIEWPRSRFAGKSWQQYDISVLTNIVGVLFASTSPCGSLYHQSASSGSRQKSRLAEHISTHLLHEGCTTEPKDSYKMHRMGVVQAV
jgi:hypothetical protein